MSKKPKQSLNKLFPWYVNNSLSDQEREAVDSIIKNDPQARIEIEAWKKIRITMTNQPQKIPSPMVRQRLMTSIRTPSEMKVQKSRWIWNLASGALLTLSIFILLWLAVRPGVVLQWSLARDGITGYRIYRTPLGKNQFDLIKDVPAQANRLQYYYVDAFILPGANYIYRVEGIRSDGTTIQSTIVNGRARDVMPSQVELFLSSIILGYGIVIFSKKWSMIAQRKTLEYNI